MTGLQAGPSEPRNVTVDERQAVIRGVLRDLGRPDNLYRVTAEKVWNGQYRVNVYCSVETDGPVKPVGMTDSFFVSWEDGAIVSKPPIARKYE